MKKAVIASIMTTLPFCAVNAALAETYATLGISGYRFELENSEDPVNLTAATILAGVWINEHVGIEARYGRSLSGGDIDPVSGDAGGQIGSRNAEFKVDRMIGIFGRLSSRDDFDSIIPYLVVGLTQLQVSRSSDVTDESAEEIAGSIGAGIDACGEVLCVNLELTLYQETDDYKFIGFTTGLTFNF